MMARINVAQRWTTIEKAARGDESLLVQGSVRGFAVLRAFRPAFVFRPCPESTMTVTASVLYNPSSTEAAKSLARAQESKSPIHRYLHADRAADSL
jgi:hypothetical protein